MRQVMDAFDSGENKYGKLAKAARQKDNVEKVAIKDKTERLENVLQEKGAALVPRGEWSKFISWLINQHLGDNTPHHSAIYAFTAGYMWQKDRKNWVSRNIDNLPGISDRLTIFAENLHRKIAYH
jgi:hypothetical protein